MSTRTRLLGLRRLAVAAASLTAALAAAQTPDLPAAQVANGVRYITGGIGEGESAAFRRERARFPLAIEVYARDEGRDAFTAEADVTVRDATGHTVLQTMLDGPFLLAEVPPGRYAIEVTLLGVTQRQQATVRARRSARNVFVFAGGVR